MTNKLLVVEDAKMFSRLLKSRLERMNYEVCLAESLAEAQQQVENPSNSFSLAILDLNLPDAPEGEVVDCILDHEIPSIVFTAEFSNEVRELMVSTRRSSTMC